MANIALKHLGIIGLVLFSSAFPSVSAKCFVPNGNVASGDSPCDPDAEYSACCGGGFGTVCLENHLCQSGNGQIIRGTCSKKDWGTDACARYCLNADTGGTDLISCSNVTDDSTSYCCDHTDNCCDTGVGRFQVLPSSPATIATWDEDATQFLVIATSSSSSSSSTGSATTTGTGGTTTFTGGGAATTPTSDATGAGDGVPAGLSTGAKAGIGIGVALGAVLVACVVYLFVKLNRTHKLLSMRDKPDDEPAPAPTPELPAGHGASPELPDAQPPRVMPDSYYAAKAPGPPLEMPAPHNGRFEAHELPGDMLR